MITIKWVGEAWRVEGYGISFICPTYAEAWFFKKYEADIDNAFMYDYLMDD